jgi:hypothetical protein
LGSALCSVKQGYGEELSASVAASAALSIRQDAEFMTLGGIAVVIAVVGGRAWAPPPAIGRMAQSLRFWRTPPLRT